tara:strand:- start:89 stop:280 length:192 start_codon:yes stop_codon:yes gene_type:complete
MIDKDLFVSVKPQYGKNVLYPLCYNSKLLAQIAGTKTITPEHKKLLELMGYQFNFNAEYYNGK